jgi:hypothetical protein
VLPLQLLHSLSPSSVEEIASNLSMLESDITILARFFEEGKDVFKDATSFRILSIGTGLGDVVAIKKIRTSILRVLKDLATSSKQVADRLETAYEGNELYYRFNIQNGLQDVTILDWEQASDISAHTMSVQPAVSSTAANSSTGNIDFG